MSIRPYLRATNNLNLDTTVPAIIEARHGNPAAQLDAIDTWLERLGRRIDRPWSTDMGTHAQAMKAELGAVQTSLETVAANIWTTVPLERNQLLAAFGCREQARLDCGWARKKTQSVPGDRYSAGTITKLHEAREFLADAAQRLRSMLECAS